MRVGKCDGHILFVNYESIECDGHILINLNSIERDGRIDVLSFVGL